MARQATKDKTGDYRQLDARRIARFHGYSVGHQFSTLIMSENGPTSEQVRVFMFDGRVEIETEFDQLLGLRWPITITRSSLNSNNGWRWWFSCPCCDRRAAILYLRSKRPPGCRACMNLAYASQSEGTLHRAIRKKHKIYRRLGWDPGEPSTWHRPKGQWARTTRKLSGKINECYGRMGDAMAKLALFKRYA